MRVAVVEFARLPSHFPLHSLAFYHPRMDCRQNLPALLPPTITSLPYSRKMRVAAVEFARFPSHFPLHNLVFYHPRMDCRQNLPALLPPIISSRVCRGRGKREWRLSSLLDSHLVFTSIAWHYTTLVFSHDCPCVSLL